MKYDVYLFQATTKSRVSTPTFAESVSNKANSIPRGLTQKPDASFTAKKANLVSTTPTVSASKPAFADAAPSFTPASVNKSSPKGGQGEMREAHVVPKQEAAVVKRGMLWFVPNKVRDCLHVPCVN